MQCQKCLQIGEFFFVKVEEPNVADQLVNRNSSAVERLVLQKVRPRPLLLSSPCVILTIQYIALVEHKVKHEM